VIKLWSPLKRRPELTLEQFAQHWRTIHRELALRLVPPGYMQGYVQNHRLPDPVPGLRAPGDGCPEVWVGPVENVVALGNSPEYREGALLDEPKFMMGNAVPTITRTRVAQGTPRVQLGNSVKAMFFLPPSVLETRDDADWIEHGSWMLPGSTPQRLERERSLTATEALGIASEYGGIESTWWPSVQALQDAWLTHAPSADVLEGVDAMLVRELIVVPPAEWQ
jgi:EthD domain